MKNKITYALGCASLVSLIACGNPAAPTLGKQIDRIGRPAINTALTDPFGLTPVTKGQTTDQTKDAYNSAAISASISVYTPLIKGNLAILDGLDGVCGNQFAADLVASARYSGLAGILADDELYLNTANGTCTTYLGVEANAGGVTNKDCGGRTPLEDTIDESYSLLAAGALSGVTDGISADADATASLTDFPFLTAPN